MGAPGPGVEQACGDCPRCKRVNVPGGVDRETGHLWLRRHKEPSGARWCSSKQRVDVGPASTVLHAEERSGADVVADAFVDGQTVDDPALTSRIQGHLAKMHGRGPAGDPRVRGGTSSREARRALERKYRRGRGAPGAQ